jgi:hypothetical protein
LRVPRNSPPEYLGQDEMLSQGLIWPKVEIVVDPKIGNHNDNAEDQSSHQ